MSIRVSRQAPKGVVAMAGLMVAAVALTGCSSLGSRTFGDPRTTGSIQPAVQQNLNQPMPAQVADNQFVPPANVGGWAGQSMQQPAWGQPAQNNQPSWNQPAAVAATGVQSQDLPVLSNQSQGSVPAMHTQTAFASASAPSPSTIGMMPTNNAVPTIAATSPSIPTTSVTGAGYTHTIANGESLYTIARRYEVTTQALVQANNLSSPDKIVVGQKIIIPGRADLMANKAPTQTASVPAQATLPQPAQNPIQAAKPAETVAVTQPVVTPTPTDSEAETSGSDKFRWPASGRVVVDFASSKGTGINIEVPEGTSVKAAENGTVIYVGSGVEGYGNLVLIRHPNGYVSAYAHLKSMSVAKGAVVNRGEAIGSAGMTGSVTKPQLHFEIRKGATPVDPVPLLAG
jgi:murein DD-endopeptidase MepM/ murein hydrolase activator NlpD